jgi:hypothetical protein
MFVGTTRRGAICVRTFDEAASQVIRPVPNPSTAVMALGHLSVQRFDSAPRRPEALVESTGLP